MTLKKIAGKIHLWLGLSTGLVVFIVSITGCLYAFEREIQDALQPYRFSEVQQKPVLPPSAFEAVARKELPEWHLHAINYPAKDRSVEAIFYGFEPEEHYYVIYVNPYTAEIIHTQDMNKTFFRWVINGHYYMWLPPNIGQPLTSYATLLFVFMLISGIVLWWPKNKAAARQRFWFKWKPSTKWKRKNYDLHNIPGFYSSALLLIIAITGIFFGIQWFTKLVYTATGGEKDLLFSEPISKVSTQNLNFEKPVIDLVWEKMKNEHPDALSLEVHTIESDSATIGANVNTNEGVHWSADYRYFDQYTLEEVPVKNIYGRLKDADTADLLIRMTYDIHTGGILGFAGKVLAFGMSLIAASLPVTGFMIWWGRNRGK
ncbi:PepSY-associated TM helix domain-containing protein [Jiulongibacter sediminis]|uniref:Peptidase M4 n=1 Tax=Jiulongibacter sediminis TaxID=1605367 RepID=A0A0P7BPH1_9BACT|nr:PepSY-associated TM helix domain-containing protein [Jiulongibacter sediminis]KPM47155.1 peptidase M4 [Jiulongibacter sediminis]TBX22714.1 peptidase M4 [Jiulongibacter sediminis]